MSDVVYAVGPGGAERVLLRGASLRVADGETVLLAGMDAETRQCLTALLTGRRRPRYGRVSSGRVRSGRLGDRLADWPAEGGTAVLDAGEAPADGALAGPLPEWRNCAVVVLGGPGWQPDAVAGRHRTIFLAGGQLVDVARAEPAAVVWMRLGEVRRRAEHALVAAGVSARLAATVSAALVDADRRGHSSHGVALLPTYLRRIRAGGIVADAVPQLTALSPVLASVDAGGGFGQPAAEMAARWCAASAAQHGLAAAAVHSNNHVGMLAAYRWPFQEHGVIGLILNTSAPSVAAPGARRATLGSNAICLVTPTKLAGEPFCIDMATGVVAAGKIRDADNRGTDIPLGWLQDSHGEPTTDPAQLDQGGSIPLFGDYKGLCVTLIAEILAGVLAGGRVSPDIAKQGKQPRKVMGSGQLFVGFSVPHLTEQPKRADLPAPVEVGALIGRLRAAVQAGYDVSPPPWPWFPDQREAAGAERADTRGVNIPLAVLAELGWDRP